MKQVFVSLFLLIGGTSFSFGYGQQYSGDH